MATIYAHRGASAELPENTLPAFGRAVELRAFGIELDVHLSADGVPVVIHDETVDRTTNGSGAVAELTVAQLQELDAGNGEPVPTLEQVLDLVSGKVHVNIEIKAGEAGDAVLALTGTYPDLAYAISSFNHEALRNVRNHDATIELWPLVAAVSDADIATAKEIGAPQLNAFGRMLNAEIMSAVAEQGIGIWVWTVNDVERARELIEWGAVGICTDDPQAMLEGLTADQA